MSSWIVLWAEIIGGGGLNKAGEEAGETPVTLLAQTSQCRPLGYHSDVRTNFKCNTEV